MKSQGQLSGDTIITRSGDLLTTEVDGELMAMSVERGTCYGLNGVGTRIWALIAEPRSLDELCAQLLDEYDVDDETCRREVVDLLEGLSAESLVTIRSR